MFPGHLGLQGQGYVNGALGRDDSTGAGTREQHSGRVLTHLVEETSERDKYFTGRVYNQQHITMF